MTMFQHLRKTLRDRQPPSREGTALVVVLVVIVLLSLAAYSFSEKMVLEAEAAEFSARQAQARVAADSGIEYAAAILGTPADPSEEINLYHDPASFGGMFVPDSLGSTRDRMFTFVAPVGTGGAAQQVRFGLIDESGKLNLNAVAALELDEEQLRNMFLNIPNMTEDVADSILDWIDEDSDPRAFGAESDLYQTLMPPYFAKDGPLESLDELLLVSGVTPELLYGEDANRNGLLDPNEDDGELSMPLDNADGALDLGWAAYFTIYSRETNLNSDGEPKTDINDSVLVDLYDALEAALGEDQAQFIVAYRMFGATNVEPLDDSSAGGSTTGDEETDEALSRMAEAGARAIAGGGSGDESVTRGGMDLSRGPSVTVQSLYELIDAEVEAEMDNGTSTTTTTLTSPWTSDAASLATDWPLLLDTVTTNTAEVIEGRININQARREVLLGIPDMEPQIADAIVAAQEIGLDGAVSDRAGVRQTAAWLLGEGLADVTMMRRLDPYITAKGDVYAVQIIGHSDRVGPVARVDAIIDATSFPPRITARRDLSDLGPGFDVLTLLGGANTAGGP
jgi:DNA uptake protein ComE-like DNA-binding protein